jgi:hypothetical protein
VDVFWSILTAVIGVVGGIWILWKVRNLDRARHDEDQARAFFECHGHWPDETPEEAEQRRAQLRRAPEPPPLATPTDDGYV